MADRIKFRIEADGTMSFTTDEVSPENHVSADQFLRQMSEALGGKVNLKERPHAHGEHVHTHEHEHGHVHHHFQ